MKFINLQKGSTLLLAVFVMASLTLVAIAVSAFTVSEIRASRGNLVTEPAINAAETAAEEALWTLKRTDDLTLVPFCSSSTISNPITGSNSIAQICRKYSGQNYFIENGSPKAVYLYDPDDVNGDVDLLAYPYSN